MKVYLDDERPCPPGWTIARWPDEAVSLLESGEVTHLSLDHDLGDDERAIRQIRAVLGMGETCQDDAIVATVRDLKDTLADRDRWVVSLLAELSRRRLKLSQRGLMEHEQRFLEEKGDKTKDT